MSTPDALTASAVPEGPEAPPDREAIVAHLDEALRWSYTELRRVKRRVRGGGWGDRILQ